MKLKPMKITKNTDHTTTITMPKQWVVNNANEDKNTLLAFITEGNNRLILDFSHTEFIDSTGLGTLVALLKSCRQHNGGLALCNLSPKVQALIELTQLHKIFIISENVTKAQASLNE